ncbi:hypothetical protein [Wolbachia endosymbiont (group A) of Beris morrisii]|uniref:hypothetical protein n=1 Tax=Wolbachia endosymbiont (group A) of Beris morrisii TaxID=3066139 RepID=UPI0033429459
MSTSNLKISIAALSLCVSAVAIYIHLPYVIAAVSGSGAIEAVPLAIFAVSAIVALVSVICLIRLAVSRAGDKKKIDLSGEESGHTASQEPQKLVHENSTNLESKPIRKEFDKPVKQDSGSQIKVDSGTSSQDKSSVPTPSQPPQIRDTASSQVPHSVPQFPSSLSSGAVPPPPPSPAPNSNGTPLPRKADSPYLKTDHGNALLKQIKKDPKLKHVKELDAVQSNKGTDKKETQEEYNARVDKLQDREKEEEWE